MFREHRCSDTFSPVPTSCRDRLASICLSFLDSLLDTVSTNIAVSTLSFQQSHTCESRLQTVQRRPIVCLGYKWICAVTDFDANSLDAVHAEIYLDIHLHSRRLRTTRSIHSEFTLLLFSQYKYCPRSKHDYVRIDSLCELIVAWLWLNAIETIFHRHSLHHASPSTPILVGQLLFDDLQQHSVHILRDGVSILAAGE